MSRESAFLPTATIAIISEPNVPPSNMPSNIPNQKPIQSVSQCLEAFKQTEDGDDNMIVKPTEPERSIDGCQQGSGQCPLVFCTQCATYTWCKPDEDSAWVKRTGYDYDA